MDYLKAKTSLFLSIASLFALIQLAACNNHELPGPVDDLEKGDSVSIPVPGDSLEVPADSLSVPGDTVNIPEVPIEVYGRIRMQWAPTDYREIYFDGDKSPVKTIQENLYVQNSDITRKTEVSFFYNENKQLKQTRSSNGTYVNYTYENNQVKKTEEFASDGFLIKTRHYEFDGNKLLKVLETNHYNLKEAEVRYFYGAFGNLTEVRDYIKNSETQAFDRYNAVRYSNYDARKNSENLWTVYPYLPTVQFAVNNFREVSFFYFDGKVEKEVSQRKHFSYQYNPEGYPTQRTETGSGYTLTAAYSYTGI